MKAQKRWEDNGGKGNGGRMRSGQKGEDREAEEWRRGLGWKKRNGKGKQKKEVMLGMVIEERGPEKI